MAIIPGTLCLHCETTVARPDSHYCSDACSAAFLVAMKGPVQCAYCMHECDTVAEAKRKRWRKIQPDSEGISYNFSGICPACWKKENAAC